MDTFLQKIEGTFNSGEPEVRKWFLVRNTYLPFFLCGFYALFATTIGPAIMRKRKPFELRTVMVLFNFFLVITYTVSLILTILYLPKLPWHHFCKGGANVKEEAVAYILARTGWVVYILKYLEFLDTVFFVLRKKQNQITFLHVIHHTIVPICGWIIFRTERSGAQSVPVIINMFVHIIMYSYYGLAAIGPGVRKYLWWKKHLTLLQMIQFCSIILYVGVIAPYLGCKMFISSFIMDVLLAPFFLYLFYQYYKKNFLMKGKSIEINGNVKNGSLKNGALEAHNNTNGGMMVKASTNGMQKKQK